SDLGVDLIAAPEWTLLHGCARRPVHAGPRVGVSKAVLMPWRFFEHPNPHVSRHRKGEPVERHKLPSLIPQAGTPIE
ncbi:MAG: 3-methyladenine DNA glycosylase, partial [Chloroflexota bacterium]|nr:3-methyladenine DNA glycosylase [Chloroflexota bacterium]